MWMKWQNSGNKLKYEGVEGPGQGRIVSKEDPILGYPTLTVKQVMDVEDICVEYQEPIYLKRRAAKAEVNASPEGGLVSQVVPDNLPEDVRLQQRQQQQPHPLNAQSIANEPGLTHGMPPLPDEPSSNDSAMFEN